MTPLGGFGPPVEVIDTLINAIGDGPAPVVLIDGRSGSGKSTLAAPLGARLGATLVHMDALYQGGWDGLEAGSVHVHDEILAATHPRWRSWNWVRNEPGRWHDVDPRLPLIVEGSGALNAANRQLASFAIWVELANDELRKARAIARDGQTYAVQWDRWAVQETSFFTREKPWLLADVIVDGINWQSRFRGEATHCGPNGV